MTVNSDISLAVQYIQQGQVGKAEEICKNILSAYPFHADALHYLGVTALQQGHPGRAVKLIDRAIRIDSHRKNCHENHPIAGPTEQPSTPTINQGARARVTRLNPDSADALYNLGLALNLQGRIEDAVFNFLKALELNPRDGSTLYNLGCIYRSQGQDEKAIDFFRRTLEIEPSNASAYNNLGIVLNATGRSEEALTYYKKALAVNPNAADVYTNLGCAFRQLQRIDEAVKSFKKAIAIEPNDAIAHYNLGIVLKAHGSTSKAISSFQKAVELKPNFAEAYNNLGNAFKETGDGARAIQSFGRAVEKKPDYVDAHVNMGSMHQVLGNNRQAVSCYQKALEINPEFAEAHNNLGSAFCDLGNLIESQACYRKALELKPDYTEAHSNLLFGMNYDPELTNQTMSDAANEWWQQHGIPIANRFSHQPQQDNRRKLKIGYVSPDFRQHSVSHFFLPLMSAHDDKKVEVFCYSDEKHPDVITDRIRQLSHHWRWIADMTNDDVAAQIFEDRIDILVDLAGHTAGNRLPVFARKPAPVQATWLGYPNTTGLSVIDYRITDAVADPEGETDQYYSETLIRLPHGFLCYAPNWDTPAIAKLPASESGTVTFGSFNNLAKINSRVIAAWSKILDFIPNSRLLLKGKQLSDEFSQKRFFELFSQNGICADRIKMLPTTRNIPEHLNLYSAVDIGLDPFPYNGTTTTCEALWMGVPVISLCGDRHASRVGASILTRIGCKDLITKTEKDYIKKAVELAGNLKRLVRLRAGMRLNVQQSPLCDAESFGREMERTYRSMWQNWCSGNPSEQPNSETRLTEE